MVDWAPISKEALLQRIAQGEARMLPAELHDADLVGMKVPEIRWR